MGLLLRRDFMRRHKMKRSIEKLVKKNDLSMNNQKEKIILESLRRSIK